MRYSPGSPMSTGGNSGSSGQSNLLADVAPIMNLLAADEELCEAVKQVDAEIVKLVMQLGGSEKSYRRERAQQTKQLISEIYSVPRVTRALKFLPNLNLQAGFALDITNTDENGDQWDFTQKVMRDKAYALVEEQKPYCLVGSPGARPSAPTSTSTPPGTAGARRR